MNKRVRVVIITNIIALYRISFFNCLSSYSEIDLKVLFLAKTSPERRWKIDKRSLKFNYKVLPSLIFKLLRVNDQPSVYILNPILFFSLLKENPDIVVGAEFSISALTALFYAKFFRKRYICWSDEAKIPFPAFKPPNFFRSLSRKIIIFGSSTFIASSTLAKENLIFLGANPKRIFISYLTTDIDFFRKNVENYYNRKWTLRKKLGWNNKPVILYCGYLRRRKGLIQLLQAFRILQKGKCKAKLIIIGDGPLKEELINYCQKNNLEENVYFPGNKSQEELPLYYGLADLFVFPSLYDHFGIVVLEALASGLPVICSKFAGVAKDAIVEGKNGYIVDPTDSLTLVTKIERILKDSKLQEDMVGNARQFLTKFNPEKVASNFIKSILYSIKVKNEDTPCP